MHQDLRHPGINIRWTKEETGERGVGAALERLHLDHERPLHATCHRWRAAMPAVPRSWDDGLDGAALCHDLFGVCAAHGAACVGRHPAERANRTAR